MELLVERAWPKGTYTIGKLFVDGVRFCETLEDRDRGLLQSMPLDIIKKIKVYAETAIPRGRYEIKMSYSAKFAGKVWARPTEGMVPEICDVPGFSGVRIHPGTTAEDTLGCLLVGKNTAKGKITSSQLTYRNLIDNYIAPAIGRGERVFLTIK